LPIAVKVAMKFNYKLQRLCGAYYGHPTSSSNQGGKGNGSNLVYSSDGNTLISAVSNRVQVLDLKTHTVRTLPIEARSSIRCLALSPDDAMLLVIDSQNYAMLVNFHRGIVLHRLKFKKKVRQCSFSPDGRYLAVTQGKHVQVWFTPNHMRKEFSPLILHRTYTGQSDDVTYIHWSSDSSVLLAGSRDATARIWTVNTTRNYQPVTLSGHKSTIVGTYFSHKTEGTRQLIDSCYTISEDGALVNWQCTYGQEEAQAMDENDGEEFDVKVDDAVDFFSGGESKDLTFAEFETSSGSLQSHELVKATWRLLARHYFHQEGAKVTSTTYCERAQILVVGFSTGLFGLYELPSVSNIHTLSVGSNQVIKSCILNNSGDWLALGCPQSQQLLVWEWRSETYVLKQRGHSYGMRTMAYSPDGVVICTGGEDGKLKLWNATSGFCYVTMEKTHTAPVTAVAFANSSVVVSASLDGTVRAHDLHRYRTFKTLTTPTPVQFLSLAVDSSGELVAAGSADPFHIYVWNLQTAKLLDVLTGHQGPIVDLSFQSSGGIVASASWDGTIKLWDVYKTNVPTESFQHTSDVVCLAFRFDGKEICTGTIGGLLTFWDVEDGKLKFEIDGRRDIAGGRKLNDRMTSNNNAASRYFTSICYSADGSCVLAGGNSKYVCIYEVSQQILLKKFQVTFNRSLDGVLDEVSLYSKVARREWCAMMMNSHKRFAELADGLTPLGAL
jgi:periodic tryptophan protein 2